MNTELTISKVTATDIDELVQLVNSAYRGDSSRQGWTTEAELLEGVRTDPITLLAQINQPGHTILKAVNEAQEIIACVGLEEKSNKLYLGMLTVNPTIQANGIGKKMLQAADDFALARNLHCIEMTVISVRSELIAYYERRGYQRTGEKRDFPTDPKFGIKKQDLEFIVLEKKLA